ncbi:phosphoserine phosphatase SerB [Pontixanthobacter gangjinensis]
MLIARLIADTAGLETRLKGAAAAMASAGIATGTEIGSRLMDDGRTIMQIAAATSDTTLLRQIVDANFAPDAAMVTIRDYAPLRLFVSDMDSTMIEQECIDELADFAGVKDKVADITERTMQGELDFEASLRERVALLAGLEESVIEECLANRIHPTSGARTLVQTLKAAGCHCVLVTGGFHHFADSVAAQLGFDHVVANRLQIADGKLTGKLDGPIADGATKRSVLETERKAFASGTVLATGDGANDIPMLSAADFSFAYKAKPAARSAASGFIDRGDLTAILQLLDIPQSDWAQ